MSLWWVDILILVVIAYNLFMGLRRGFIRSIVDLTGLYMASILGVQYGQSAVFFLHDLSGVMLPYPRIMGFLLIWVAVFLSMVGIGLLLDKLFSVSFLGPINLLGGGLFGGAKGLVFVLPIILPILFFRPTWLDSSVLVQLFKPQLTPIAAKLFSEENMTLFSDKLSESDLIPADKLEGVDLSQLKNLSGELNTSVGTQPSSQESKSGWGKRFRSSSKSDGSSTSLLKQIQDGAGGSGETSLEEIQQLLRSD